MNNIDGKPHGNARKMIKCSFIGIAAVLPVIVTGTTALFWQE